MNYLKELFKNYDISVLIIQNTYSHVWADEVPSVKSMGLLKTKHMFLFFIMFGP